MFKHILIPTDGSNVAAKAIGAGVRLAAEMGAKVTGFHAEQPRPLRRRLHADGYAVEKDLIAELDRRSHQLAEQCVAQIADAAKADGVPFEAVVVKSTRPYEAIIQAAQERNCDAIFMASHGYRGLDGLLLGSITQQVLTHSKIPVLVYR